MIGDPFWIGLDAAHCAADARELLDSINARRPVIFLNPVTQRIHAARLEADDLRYHQMIATHDRWCAEHRDNADYWSGYHGRTAA